MNSARQQLVGMGEKLSVYIGPHGYQEKMFVYNNEEANKCNLADGKATVAYAEAALQAKTYLVSFSSDQSGSGVWLVVPMSEVDAEKFPINTEVIFTIKKTIKLAMVRLSQLRLVIYQW